MAVGLLESFELIERFGSSAVRNGLISTEDLLSAAKSKQRLGCKSLPNRMTSDEKTRVMEIGVILKEWRSGL